MSDSTERDREFRDFVVTRTAAMRTTAYLLCGDWHEAEDITQTAFVKLYLMWNRIDRRNSVDAYMRQIVTRTFLAERRRMWRRREDLTAVPVETPEAGVEPEYRILLWNALSAVPPRQRAALVLRYWLDLSVEETARTLGCSTGNVKSQCARGLRTLRTLLERDSSEDMAWSRGDR